MELKTRKTIKTCLELFLVGFLLVALLSFFWSRNRQKIPTTSENLAKIQKTAPSAPQDSLPVKTPLDEKLPSMQNFKPEDRFRLQEVHGKDGFVAPPQSIHWDRSCSEYKKSESIQNFEDLVKPIQLNPHDLLIQDFKVEDFSYFYQRKSAFFTLSGVWQMNEPPSYTFSLFKSTESSGENPILVDPRTLEKVAPSMTMVSRSAIYDFVVKMRDSNESDFVSGSRIVLLSVKAPSLLEGTELLFHRIELYNSWARAYSSGDIECLADQSKPIPLKSVPELNCSCGNFKKSSFP